MLDIRLFRENINAVRDGIAAKNVSADVDRVVELDRRRRELVALTEDKKKERNELSMEVGKRIKAGEDAEPIKAQVRQITEDSESMVAELAQIDTDLDAALLNIPNLPHESVPRGRDETANVVVRTWGEAPVFQFPVKPHWELATELGVIDFEEGTRISGSGFIVYKGSAARLQRTLINFMLDLHTLEHGYTEILPPYLVNRGSMTGTGQLPKFEEDAYKVDDDLFLIPTAEVPLTNLNREKILPQSALPINYTAYTPCFRREAGSYGRETRGITRIHQFDKVELVKLVNPEDSFTELEILLGQAEAVLQQLGLHYRVLEICTGDLGFSNVKQYDLEVWAPGMNAWLEVSSCSNFTDYQARRANIRFRREARTKPEFVHTLNGSGLALPRTMVAIFEQYQQADGSVAVPEILRQSFKADRL